MGEGQEGRETEVAQRRTTLGRGGVGGELSARGYMLLPSPDSSEAKASRSSCLSRASSLSVPFSGSIQWKTMSVRSGPSPQKQLWGQECETQTFRRLPDLNQSHRPATESPIESCTTAKCRYIVICAGDSHLFLKKKPHIWLKDKVEKMSS